MPAVSIILPTFNRLEFLRPAVDSVLRQTFSDWDLIIADDGSGEPTQAYLRALQSSPRIKVLRLPHTGNPSATRNAALHEAKGDYIAFLDSDDLWRPAKLERQLAALRSADRCAWSYTGYDLIDDSGQLCATPWPAVAYRGAILEHLLTHRVQIWTPSVLVERRLVQRLGGFDERLVVFEDIDLWSRLACYSEVDLIDEPLTLVRRYARHFHTIDRDAAMLASRHASLQTLHRHVTDPHLRALVERQRVEAALNLAGRYAKDAPLAAARTLALGCRQSWRHGYWWAGLFWVSLKMTTPRGLLDLHRRWRDNR